MSDASLIPTPGSRGQAIAAIGRHLVETPATRANYPPTTTDWTSRFHTAESCRISDERAREHRLHAVDYVLRLVARDPAEQGKRATPIIDST
jgi:hypothetical protein